MTEYIQVGDLSHERLPQPDELNSLISHLGWKQLSPEDWESALNNSLGVAYARAADGELIASGRMVSDDTVYAYLCDVSVHPDHQGQGIGTELVTSLVDTVRGVGYNCVSLFTEGQDINPRLKSFYERCGFGAVQSGMKLRPEVLNSKPDAD